METLQLLPTLRAQLVNLKADLLALYQERQQVQPGPGYYEAMQELERRQQQLSQAFDAAQKQVKYLQQGTQASLF